MEPDIKKQIAQDILRQNTYNKPSVEYDKRVQKGPGGENDDESVRVPNQRYAVVSSVGPNGKRQRADHAFIKIRGCFESKEAARKYIDEKLKEYDPDFDIYIVDMYAWLRVPPTDEMMRNMEFKYRDPDLQKYMQGYYKQRKQDMETMEKRKKMVKRNNRIERKKMNEQTRKIREETRRSAYKNPETLEAPKTKIDDMPSEIVSTSKLEE